MADRPVPHDHSHVHAPVGATPLAVVALVSRTVIAASDLALGGDRSDSPLLVASAAQFALDVLGFGSRVFHGPAAWIEVTAEHELLWAGCWGESQHFWVANQHGEVIDLTTPVAHRRRAHDRASALPPMIASPPLIWTAELPSFYRCRPEGVAELELTEPADRARWDRVRRDIEEACRAGLDSLAWADDQLVFPAEAILCPGRRLLDDPQGTFAAYDRALRVRGLPPAPPALA